MNDGGRGVVGLGSAVHALARDVATAEVTKALEEAAISHVLLKGPSLARWLYATHEIRDSVDIDLLVSPAEWSIAASVLESLGFDPCHDEPPPGTWTAHAGNWKRSADGAIVDLHRTIAGFAPSVDALEVLEAQVETLIIAGQQVRGLSSIGRALVAALHAGNHGPAHEASHEDLRRVIDLMTPADWEQVALLARQAGAAGGLDAGLRLVTGGAAVASRLSLDSTDGGRVRIRARGGSVAAVALEELVRRRGFSAKWRFLAAELVPSSTWMRRRSQLAQRGGPGLVLAHLVRLFRVAAQTPSAIAHLISAAVEQRRSGRDRH